MKSRLRPSTTYKVLGIDLNLSQPVKLQSVPIVAMGGQRLIDRIALLEERTAKTVELQTVLQKYLEHFNYYLFGKSLTFITDHRELLSIMKEHRSNKSFYSRLSLWLGQLLPFDFNIEHIPGAKMGLVDYIFRQSNQEAKVTNIYDEEFT